MKSVLIAGCGYVGSELARGMLEAGWRVSALRRRTSELPGGVIPIAADLSRALPPAGLPADLDAVVYAVGADGRTEAAYRDAYPLGLQRVLDGLRSQSTTPSRVIFLSSTSVYAQRDGEWVDEESPTEPGGFSGQILLEAESRLLDSSLPGTVLRLGGIYGPGRTRLIDSVRSGTARRRDHSLYTNRNHRDDCARAALHLVGLTDAAPLYLGVDDDPADEASVLRFLAEQLGVGEPPLRTAAGEGLDRGRGKRCRNARLRASGFDFTYPSYREGYASLLNADESSKSNA